MCAVVETCGRAAQFWVQSRRKILHPGNPEMGIEPFRSGISVLACGQHLVMAVREVGVRNRAAADGLHLPATDGVIVKTAMLNATGHTIWQ